MQGALADLRNQVAQKMTKPFVVVAMAGGLALSLAACRNSDVAEPEESSGGKVTVRLLKEPADVREFSVTDINGKTTSSSEWRGKVVLVNFWATWCGPCRIEIPDLIALQNKYQDQLVVLGISEDEGDIPLVKKFAAEHDINYPLIMATPEIRKVFPEVMALPTTFLLDRDGKLVQKTVGLLNAKETEAGTRVLAGLATNAEVVRVEPEQAIGVDNVAQVKELPGVDLTTVPAEKRTEMLLAMNAEACNCGCGLTVARCRIDDPTCQVSLPIAKQIVEKFASAKP
jgi:thiol-disulfide isomerase/thioredoxin